MESSRDTPAPQTANIHVGATTTMKWQFICHSDSAFDKDPIQKARDSVARLLRQYHNNVPLAKAIEAVKQSGIHTYKPETIENDRWVLIDRITFQIDTAQWVNIHPTVSKLEVTGAVSLRCRRIS